MKIGSRYSPENDVTLVTSDCLKLLRKIPDGSVRLVITSPPYNLGKAYERKQKLSEYVLLQKAVITECIRITKKGGSICWQVGNHIDANGQITPLDILLHSLFTEHEEAESIRLRNRIVWHFEHGLHCMQRFSGRYETILWYTKGDKYAFNLDAVRVPQKYPGKRAYRGPRKGKFSGNPLGKNPGDLWIFPNVKGNHVEKTEHPCQFPVELPMRLIRALTKRGELVVDPYMGVGSSAVAAVLTGRRFAGADIKSKYVKISRNRVKESVSGVIKYRDPLTPVHVPRPNTPLTTVPAHFKKMKSRR